MGKHVATHETPPRGRGGFDSFLQARISRAQLLRGLGGGLGAALVGGTLAWVGTRGAADPLPYVVLIVLDGALPDYLGVSSIPHVSSLIRNGTRYTNAFAGILESETPSAHVAISTGSEPRETGIPSFWWANSENQPVSLFNPTTIRAGAMEDIIRQSGVPTLAGLVHGKYPRARVVALSGSKYYAADAIGGPDADVTMYFQGTATGQFAPTYIPGHAPPAGLLDSPGLVAPSTHMPLGLENHLTMKLATDTFSQMRQQVTLINLPEFDWPLGHVDGGILDQKGIKTLMQGFDQDLAMLQDAYRKAGVLDHTLFVLMADHGMMPLTHKVSESDFRDAVSRAGTSIVSETYTSAAYLWLADEARAPAAAQNIANLDSPYIQSAYVRAATANGHPEGTHSPANAGRPYSRVTSSKLLRAGGVEAANQYLLNSFNSGNAPDVAVLFAEGVGCEPGGQAGWKADHGGTSWEAQRIPLVLSGPGIRSGYVSPYPARLIDVAPTVLQLMGVPARRMHGLPLSDAMEAPPGWAAQRQKAASRQLMPVVAALQQESRLELANA